MTIRHWDQIDPVPEWSFEQSWRSFEEGWFEQVYEGRRLQKMAEDLHRYRTAAIATRPTMVVETGTRHGGSALWFARELDVQVITVDIEPAWGRKLGPPPDDRITCVKGSSIDPDVYYRVAEQTVGHRVMVSLDSDHHVEHVLAEIELYSNLVSPGCHLVVEDGIFDLAPGDLGQRGGRRIPSEGGALAAIRRSRLATRSVPFKRDLRIESLYGPSHSPCGWWRRDV